MSGPWVGVAWGVGAPFDKGVVWYFEVMELGWGHLSCVLVLYIEIKKWSGMFFYVIITDLFD